MYTCFQSDGRTPRTNRIVLAWCVRTGRVQVEQDNDGGIVLYPALDEDEQGRLVEQDNA